MDIDNQLQEFEVGWSGTKIISFDVYNAYINCYLNHHGVCEIKYTLK